MFKTIRVASSKNPLDVVMVAAGRRSVPSGLPAALQKVVKTAMRSPGFEADAGEVVAAGDSAILVGIGDRDELDAATARSIGARLVRRLDRIGHRAVRLHAGEMIRRGGPDAKAIGQALGEGMGVANWRVDFMRGSVSTAEPPHPSLALGSDDAALKTGLKRGLALAEAVNTARRVGATPPNVCRPSWIASEARKLAKRTGMTCKVITDAEAQKKGMGGLVNVGRGSKDKPRLVILEHRAGTKKKRDTVVLVGKTITYDTGGYSLKPPTGMKGMKYDKCGGCAVLGAMEAIAATKPNCDVVALLPAAENMVSDDAYRPDDVITMFNGVTVEVTNTDAEGRLVLADAIAYASKTYKPAAIIDAATLTGGVVVALGSWCAGLWANDEGLAGRIQSAADETGERVWRLPLWEEHRKFMRAKHADLWNSGPKRDGHPIQGAAFLSWFVGAGIPWAHLDIAGMAAVDSDNDMYVTGPTGYGVRLLAEVVAQW